MSRIANFLCAAGALSFAAPAVASVITLGGGPARSCYEAAEALSAPTQEALDQCNEALEWGNLTHRDRVATYVNRGILKFRLERFSEAVADYDAALAEDPDEAETYLNKGVAVLRLSGRTDEAVALFSTALEKGTRKPAVAYYGRAIAHETAGKIRAAYSDYRQATLLAPDWPDPKAELARFQVR